MKKIILLFFLFIGLSVSSSAQTKPNLGTAADFTILAGTGIYNKDATKVSGNVGVWPGNIIQGFTAGMINGTQYSGDATAQKAQEDLQRAYANINDLATTPGKNLTGTSLSGQILGPGVYTFDNTTTLSGTINLDAANDPNAVFIFQVRGGLLTAASTTIKLLNNARRMNIFWQVADTVNIGTRSNMAGSILAKNSIRLGKDAVVNGGRLLSLESKVVLNKNNPVTTSTDLGITKTKSLGQNGVNPYSVGEEVTFTIVARNYGPINDYNVKIVDQLDIDLDYIGATARSSIAGKQVNTFTFNRDSRIFQWTTSEFKNGEVITLTLKVRIKNPGGIGNTATILGTVTDDNFENNSASIVPAICAKISNPGEITGPAQVCVGSNTSVFSVVAIPGVQSYTWIVPSGWKILPTADGEPPANSITVELPVSTPGNPVASEGIISVTVNNGCGDSEPSTLEVAATTLITLAPGSITTADPNGLNPCIRDTETYFTYQIDPVANASAYEWVVGTPGDSTDNGGWEIVTGQNTPQIRVKAGQEEVIISVRAKNSCGTSPARTLRIKPSLGNPAKPTAITGPSSVCVGSQSTLFTVTGAASDRYNWTVPAGWTLTGQGTNQIQVIAPVAAVNTQGTITVAAVNNCGTSEAIAIVVNAVGVISSGPITGLLTPCSSTTVTYRVNATGATSFAWKVTGNLELVGNTTRDSVSVLIKPGGGTLSVSLSNACGSSQEQSLNITPQIKLTAPTSIQAASIAPCAGTSGLTFTVTQVTGASGYNWQILGVNGQPAAEWEITAVSPDQKTITVTAGSELVNISVTATNNCGNSEVRTILVTPIKTPPLVPGAITGNTNVCAGSINLRYSIKTVSGATSYVWTVPTGWSITAGQGTTQITVKAGATEGFITVKSKNICGESSLASQKKVVPSTSRPSSPGNITAGKSTVCVNEANLSYSVAAIPGVTIYNWTVPEGWIITAGQTTNTITVTAGAKSGIIYVVAYNNCGPGPASVPLPVSVTSKPAAPTAITGETIPCNGSTGIKYTATAVPGATGYLWELPEGWTITAGAGTAEITVTTSTSGGALSVKAKNDCFESDPTTLTITPSSSEPIVLGEITGSSNVCRNQTDLIYNVTPVPNVSNYVWTVPSGWEITAGQGTSSIRVNAKTNSGTISVLPRNGCGAAASATSLAVIVTNEAAVAAGTISGDQQVCAGETNLNYSIDAVSGAASYIWEVPEADGWRIISGQGTTDITIQAGSKSGNITVKAVNGCGSGPASSFAVNLVSLPTEPLRIIGTREQCAGSSSQIYQVAAVNGAESYNWKVPQDWQIESGQGTNIIRVTAGQESGNVEVTVATACGNGLTGTLAVTAALETALVPGVIGGDSKALICSGQQNITYTIEPVPGAIAYRWNLEAATDWVITGGQGTTSIQVTVGAQPATISVQAINGCGISDASTITVHPGSSAEVPVDSIAGPAVVCANQTELTYSVAAVSGATGYTWSLPAGWKIMAGENTNKITVTAGSTAGTISVVAFNSCASSIPSTLLVSISSAPTAPLSIKDESSACTGLVYSIDAVVGATGYNWLVPEGWNITEGQGTVRIKVRAPEGSKEGIIKVATQTSTCTSALTSLTVNPNLGLSNLQVANVFSPNGDGVNDTWTITNIQNYSENEIVLINRWGSEVYKTKSYQNNWNGGNLTDGTYYYILKVKICDGAYTTQKGYVMIMR
ncbi:ice-binding family protein [Adhaeribacter arboris]|nr:ice-binding family protein [Adhaeribacter arboris]